MRKSINLALAAGLAVSAFANVAAAQRASSCEVPEGAEIVTKDGLETTIQSGAVPILTRSGYDFVFDVKKKTDVTITLSWAVNGISDYDLTVHDPEENEVARADAADTTGPEVVKLKVEPCMHLVIGAVAYPGNPTEALPLTFEF